MALPGTKTANFPTSGVLDEFVGNDRTGEASRTVRVARDTVAAHLLAAGPIAAALQQIRELVTSGLVLVDGGWMTATAYVENNALTHNGVFYRALSDHTSGATSEPGVGASWATYWEVVLEAPDITAWVAEQIAARGGRTVLTDRMLPMDVGKDGAVSLDTAAPNALWSVTGKGGQPLLLVDRFGALASPGNARSIIVGAPHTAFGKQHMSLRAPRGGLDRDRFIRTQPVSDYPFMWGSRGQYPYGPAYPVEIDRDHLGVVVPTPTGRTAADKIAADFAIYPFAYDAVVAPYDPRAVTWRTRTAANSNEWRSVTYSPTLRRLAAVASTGTGNRVMTSDDWGLTWTARTSPADNNWRSICWAAALNLFVAVAYSGTGDRVMTSPDGITWTTRSSAADNEWLSVCWSPELSLLVAVANTGTTSNQVMTSPDGVNWTPRSTPSTRTWQAVCWAPALGLFVAVGASGTGTRVMTSPDGTTWTLRTAAADNGWLSVCWSPTLNLLVAVASTGTGNRVMTSPDGIAWTARATPTDLNWQSVCWAADRSMFVAVAVSGTNRVAISADGITWTQQAGDQGGWRTVIYLDGVRMFLAVATAAPSYVMSSIDQRKFKWLKGTGQSLSVWSHSGGLNGQAWYADLEFGGQVVSPRLHMFNDGMHRPGLVNDDDPIDATKQRYLVPAVDERRGGTATIYDGSGAPITSVNGVLTTTPGIAAMITAGFGADGYRFDSEMGYVTTGVGGMSIEYFMSAADGGDDDWWTNVLLPTLANMVKVAPGHVVEIPRHTFSQGETGSQEMTKTTYRGLLDLYEASSRAAIVSATGQSAPPRMYQTQIGNPLLSTGVTTTGRPLWEVSDVALAQLEKGLSADSADQYYVCCGPRYDLPFVSISHLNKDGNVMNAEREQYVANENDRRLAGGQSKFLPLHCTEVEFQTIAGLPCMVLTMHVPIGSLRLDFTGVPRLANHGFHFRGTGGNSGSMLVMNQEIGRRGDVVVLRLNQAWTGTGRVFGIAARAFSGRQGWLTSNEAPDGVWSHPGMGSNICDSAPWSSRITGLPLPNRAVSQLIAIPD